MFFVAYPKNFKSKLKNSIWSSLYILQGQLRIAMIRLCVLCVCALRLRMLKVRAGGGGGY